MSNAPDSTTENQLSNELLSMNNLLGENAVNDKDQSKQENQAQEPNVDQEPDQYLVQSLNTDQERYTDQMQDLNQEQNLNQKQNQKQDQLDNQTQDQNLEKSQNQIEHNPKNDNNEPQQETDPTKNVFATIDDELELLVPISKNNQSADDNSNDKKNVSISKPQRVTTKNFLTKRRQHAVLTFLDPKPKTEKKKALESIIHIKQPTHNFTPEEISQQADAYLKSDIIQLDDPMIVSEIIEELTSRYIEYLSKNEYIQAQNILNKIQYLRDQFRTKDAVLFMEKHLEELKTKKASLETELKSVRSVYKGKQRELDESNKKEMEELQEKQQGLWDKMEKDWSDPSKQRKYSKESKALLLGRQAERYMVLAGDLEGAEIMKRKNKQLEKTETAEAYNEMSNDFENARSKLTKFFEKQELELEEQHKMKKISLKRDELELIALSRKKIDILERMIADESNPTYKEKKILHCRLVNSVELPMLQRTAKNITAKNQLFMKTAQTTSKPLQLPPLKMAPRPTKKAKSSLARPLAH